MLQTPEVVAILFSVYSGRYGSGGLSFWGHVTVELLWGHVTVELLDLYIDRG